MICLIFKSPLILSPVHARDCDQQNGTSLLMRPKQNERTDATIRLLRRPAYRTVIRRRGSRRLASWKIWPLQSQIGIGFALRLVQTFDIKMIIKIANYYVIHALD